jgi:SAM-dependent methyltransferase
MNLLRRALTSSLRQSARAAGFANRVLEHAAIGTLTLADLRQSVDSAWDRWSTNTEAWAQSHPLMPWEQELYPRALRPDDRVLMIGCGSGRDLLALIGMGYRVDGLEPVARCAEAARYRVRELKTESQIFTGAIESFSIPAGYDAFIFSWFTYSYLLGSKARIRVLRTLRDAAPREGRLIISLPSEPRPPRRVLTRVARLSARLTGSDWLPEHGDILALSSYCPYRHWFAPGEVEEEARAGGWNVAWREESPERVAVWLLST